MDPSMVLFNSPGPDDTMTMGDSTGYSDQDVGSSMVLKHPRSHKLWPRPQESMLPLVATWNTGISTNPDYGRTTEPVIVLCSSLDPYISMMQAIWTTMVPATVWSLDTNMAPVET